MSTVFVKATRFVHQAAVRLHLAGLRSTVSQAARREKAASEAALRADAVVAQAIKQRADARFHAGHMTSKAQAIEFAAHQEALNIGGKL